MSQSHCELNAALSQVDYHRANPNNSPF